MRWTVWSAFAALCMLVGTSWIIPDAVNPLPLLEQQGVLFGVIGLIALVFAGTVRSKGSFRRRVSLSAAGVVFFGVPIVVGEYARGRVSAITRSALFAMVPVVVVMVVAAMRGEEERGARRFLVPALIGLGGLLLLLPVEFSGSTRGRVMLAAVCATVVCVGLASVWLYRLLHVFRFAEAVAVVGCSNAVVLLGWSVVGGEKVWQWSGFISMSLLVDVVEVLLIVWLLREMAPVRFAARYLAIPLVTILESFVLMHPEWTVRMVAGTVLLIVGVGVLLFWKAGDDEVPLSLR